MIPDWDTNFIYFSDLLVKRHPKLFDNLERILTSEDIGIGLIHFASDIWCRDYMPVQVREKWFVQFIYDPKYLKDGRYRDVKTNPKSLYWDAEEGVDLIQSDLILDGGNVICSETAVILTERVLEDNAHLKKIEIINKLQRLLCVDNIYIAPQQPYDIYGHIDGMMRFVNGNTILINDFSGEPIKFRKKLDKFLEGLPFNILSLKISKNIRKFRWCYINYIHVGKVIIIPSTGADEEVSILEQFKKIFKDHKIYKVPSTSILRRGGGLHCVSWNVLRSSF